MSFTSLGLAVLILRAVDEQGYTEPSPIQAQAIPAALSGNDVMAAAQTGTGKTAAFALPLLSRIDLQKLRNRRDPDSEGIHAMLDEPRRLIISILCGNELVNIASAANMTAIPSRTSRSRSRLRSVLVPEAFITPSSMITIESERRSSPSLEP